MKSHVSDEAGSWKQDKALTLVGVGGDKKSLWRLIAAVGSVEFHDHLPERQEGDGLVGRLPAEGSGQAFVLEEVLDEVDTGDAAVGVAHGLQVERGLSVAENEFAGPVGECGVDGTAVLDAAVLCLAGGGNGRVAAVEVVEDHLKVWHEETVVIAEEGVPARQRAVVLNGEVVLVEIVEVEGAAGRVRRGQEAGETDGGGEVGADRQASLKACNQVRNRVVLAIAVDEAVIGESVEARAGRTDWFSKIRSRSDRAHGTRRDTYRRQALGAPI